MKPYYCENCAFFDELKNEQPCCSCADVVPRAEVEELQEQVKCLEHNYKVANEFNDRQREMLEQLDADRNHYQNLWCQAEAEAKRVKAEVAREIFSEIEELIIKTNGMWLWQWDLDKIAELKKKYMEG